MPSKQSSILKLGAAHTIAFSPDEDRIAYFGGPGIRILSLPARKPLFAGHPIAHPSDIDFSPDGHRLAVKSTSGRTVILDAHTGRTLRDFRNQAEGEGSAALFSSCGRYVVSVSWDGLLSVRNSVTSELVFSRAYRDSMLDHLSVSRNRQYFVYSVVHHPPSDSEPPPPEAVVMHPWPIRHDNSRELDHRWSLISALELSPSGRLLAVVHGAPPETMEIYDIRHSRVAARRAVRFGGTGCSIGWSSDEKLIAINGDNRCMVLEMPELAVRDEFTLRYSCYVGFSPSSRFLALGAWSTSFIVPFDALAAFAATRGRDS